MGISIDVFDIFGAYAALEISRELLFESEGGRSGDTPGKRVITIPFFVLLFQGFHIFCDMSTKDVFLQDIGIQCLIRSVVPGETFIGVRDVDTSIAGTLENAE